ncbi:MAG: hypothetical protein ACOY31_06645 [Bacillota bacterium]
MDRKKIPGPALIGIAILTWAFILWFLTINNPSFVPVARLIFMVLIVPVALGEWLKMKGMVSSKMDLPVKVVLMAAALAAWFYWGRQ